MTRPLPFRSRRLSHPQNRPLWFALGVAAVLYLPAVFGLIGQ